MTAALAKWCLGVRNRATYHVWVGHSRIKGNYFAIMLDMAELGYHFLICTIQLKVSVVLLVKNKVRKKTKQNDRWMGKEKSRENKEGFWGWPRGCARTNKIKTYTHKQMTAWQARSDNNLRIFVGWMREGGKERGCVIDQIKMHTPISSSVILRSYTFARARRVRNVLYLILFRFSYLWLFMPVVTI